MSATANLQSTRVTVKQAAAAMNVSERMVYMAMSLMRSGRPDLVRRVEAGEIDLHKALSIAEGRQKTKPTSFDRLVKAWNSATDDDRQKLLEQALS